MFEDEDNVGLIDLAKAKKKVFFFGFLCGVGGGFLLGVLYQVALLGGL